MTEKHRQLKYHMIMTYRAQNVMGEHKINGRSGTQNRIGYTESKKLG